MSEVLPSTFVDESSFKDFNNSFDTDDPLLNGMLLNSSPSHLNNYTFIIFLFINSDTTSSEDPLLNGGFDDSPSIEDISESMNEATFKDIERSSDIIEDNPASMHNPPQASPPGTFRILTKGITSVMTTIIDI